MKKLGEGLTLQEFLKSLGLDDPDIGQEREPAKIAPSGNEPLPKSELAKIKPSEDKNKINQPSADQPSATKPKVINRVINNDVDNSADTVPNVNINNNNNINILRRLRINNISSDPARARVRVRDNGKTYNEAYFKKLRIAKFGGDFDLVAEAVNEALKAFKPADLERNRRVWLKIANRVGYENFLDAVFQQLSLFAEWESGGKRFNNKAAIFQRLLNKRFPLPKGGAQ